MPEVGATVAPDRGRAGPFTLAVSSEMVFLDLPVAERVRRLTGLDGQVKSGTGPATTLTPWRRFVTKVRSTPP